MDQRANEIWQEILALLEKEISIITYDVCITTLVPVSIIDGRLILLAADEWGRDFVSSRCLPFIKRALAMSSENLVDAEIVTKESVKDTALYKLFDEPGESEPSLLLGSKTIEEKDLVEGAEVFSAPQNKENTFKGKKPDKEKTKEAEVKIKIDTQSMRGIENNSGLEDNSGDIIDNKKNTEDKMGVELNANKSGLRVQEILIESFKSVNPSYNFENFVVGKCNRLAYAAASAVSEEPGARYNPLFIYGGAGLGKTHLMHAIGNQIRLNAPKNRILFVTSEKFVNDLVADIGLKKDGALFREKYRSADVLMVDDIQFIAGKPATTEQIFHTFNDFYSDNKQMIFTSDRYPKDIPEIDERLKSRFEWGFTADVQPPDLETRIAILRKKAQILKVNVSRDVLNYMAECIKSNVREMEGLLNKVLMLSRLEECPPSIEIVKEALKVYPAVSDGSFTADDIIDAACKLFGIKREDILGKKKTRDITYPRQLCIYCMTEMLDLPLAAIGNLLGGRDHTTVLHARNKVAEQAGKSAKTKADIENIKSMTLKK